MKKDKLSREELLKEFDDIFRGCPLTKKGIQAHEQIKSLLTPIPENKLDEFVEKQIKGFKLLYLNCDDLFSRFLINLQSWRLKKLLKEYDELRKG